MKKNSIHRRTLHAGCLGHTIPVIIFCTSVLSAASDAGNSDSLRFADAWKTAVKRIISGEVHDGFLVLDSLRRSVAALNDSLLFDYARLVSRLFLPDTANQVVDSVITVSNAGNTLDGIFLNDEEEIPEGRCWTVMATADTQAAMPSFSYDRQFYIRERMKLRLPPLGPGQHPEVDGLLGNESYRQISTGPLLYDPGEEPWKVHLKIIVDCSNRPESLSDYVGNLVTSRYDYITVKRQKELRNALSLRCYNHQVFHSRPGAFCGFVAFDRIGGPGMPTTVGALPKNKKTDPIRVRYLIVVKANQAIEDKAEQILLNVLARFKSL